MTTRTTPRTVQRSPLLVWTLAAACVVIPVAEVWALISIGGWIGLWPTLALLVVGAAVGAWLMKREGSRAWEALVQAMKGGQLPTGRLADAALVLVGGVLLMLPGFLTDILGLLFLLPATRPLVRRLIGFVVARRQHPRASGDATVIRGEVVEAGIDDGKP